MHAHQTSAHQTSTEPRGTGLDCWLDALDAEAAAGYRPVVAIFRDADGELRVFSALDDDILPVLLHWMAEQGVTSAAKVMS